jgi:hypothetical protein
LPLWALALVLAALARALVRDLAALVVLVVLALVLALAVLVLVQVLVRARALVVALLAGRTGEPRALAAPEQVKTRGQAHRLAFPRLLDNSPTTLRR